MLRQASSRNHRSKGFKVKNALQICLLVAICIWLLYQVKHSHEKKRAFEERNLKTSRVGDSQVEFFKFGRRDLPQIEDTVSVNETHEKEEENEEAQEEEHDSKQEEIEGEEGRVENDDEIDEQDQDKGDEEAEHEEESTEEDDRDSHEKESDHERENGHEEVDVFDNQEHEGGTQEAREENYKRDDASSAVVHDTHVTDSETGTGGAGNTYEDQVIDKVDDDSTANGSKDVADIGSNGSKDEDVGEILERKVVESDDGSKGDNDLSAGSEGASVGNVTDAVSNGTESIQFDHLSANVTAADNKDIDAENKDVEIEFSKPDNITVSNVSNSATVESNNQMEQQTNLTMAAESNTQVGLQTNSTGGLSDHPSEVHPNSTLVAATGISTLNDTAILDSAQTQNNGADDATVEEESRNVVEQADNADTTTAVLDSEEHTNILATEGEGDDPSHAVITEEEKDARIDLSTLPEIQNEDRTTSEEAAE